MKNQTINIIFMGTDLEVEYYVEGNWYDEDRDIEELNIEFVRVGGIDITEIMEKYHDELNTAVYDEIIEFYRHD
jgi:hypothetical protein